MGALIWTGDSDPEAQTVTQDGIVFVKGESTQVKDKAVFERLKDNPVFSTDAKDVVEADEPSEEERIERAEAGTVKAALKAQLRAMGVEVRGNPSEDTLRNKLAEAHKA